MYCNKCHLRYKNKQASDNFGNRKGRFLIIRDIPSSGECNSGKLYSKSVKVLNQLLDTYSIADDTYVTSVLRCYPKLRYDMDIVNTCLPHLRDLLISNKYDKIILAGLMPAIVFLEAPHLRRIEDVVGKRFYINQTEYIITYPIQSLSKSDVSMQDFKKVLTYLFKYVKYNFNINLKMKL